MWIFAATAALGCMGCEPQMVKPEDVLARPPYLGVSCRTPNSVACDRVGLAVWLRRPARRVDAEIAGRHVALDDGEWSGDVRRGQRTQFAGFLERAGMNAGDGPLAVRRRRDDNRWLGDPRVVARVRLHVTLVDGRILAVRVSVPLSAGWG